MNTPAWERNYMQRTPHRRPWLPWVLLSLLVLAAGAVRLYDLGDPPLDFHPTRQLHSLIVTRGIYYAQLENVDENRRSEAIQFGKAQGVIEPQILEQAAAQVYHLAGRELPWLGRVFSIIFWVAGGVILYLLTRRALGDYAGLAAAGFALALPYGVFASRSFQPDPLMTMLILLAWLGLLAWLERPGWLRVIAAGLAAGLAILVKPTAVFFIAPVWAAGLLGGVRLKAALRDPQRWIAGLLAILPVLLVYLVRFLQADGVAAQFSLRFFPQYWFDPAFYLRWYGQLRQVLGLPWLLAGLLGLLFLPARPVRVIAWGGWAGYLLMGLTLSHHISTHDYYHLPVIPLVGLGVAALAAALVRGLPNPPLLSRLVFILLAAGAVVMGLYDARTALKRVDYRAEPAFWQSLADQIRPLGPVVGLTQDYGLRLVYWGWILPQNWFSADEIRLRRTAGQPLDLDALLAEKAGGASVFLVTWPEEFARQPELQQALDDRFTQIPAPEGVWIYDLQHPVEKGLEIP